MSGAAGTFEDRAASLPAKKAGKDAGRSLWWVVHSWVGLKLSLFMAWVLLTGTFAVFAVEFDWLARPAMRVTPSQAPHASWGTIADAAVKAVPDASVTFIYAPPHAWFAAEAIAETGPNSRVRVYLNPYEGTVQGVAPWMSFLRFFREMHRHLLLPIRYGVPIVSSMALLLVLSVVTGLVSYKKFWRGFFRRPRAGSARKVAGDLHRLGGLWSLWFVILIALTGLWYLVESLGGGAPIPRAPKIEANLTAPLSAARIDELVRTGQEAYPNLRITELRLPSFTGGPLGVFGQADAWVVRDRVNGVWLDPVSGKVLEVWKGETLTAHQRISEAADPLHFGTWGGMTTKIVWFVFGAVMTALAVTGVMIYSLRLKVAYATEEDAKPQGGFMRAWRGMGVWAYPGAGLVLMSLALLPGWLAR
ncbi:MAG: PepSY-associated TM helix domain-containing protein [Rhodospirillaceae bacterium]